MLNVSGIQGFLLGLVGIAVIIVGLKIIFGAKKAQFSETANTSLNTIIGLTFVAIGVGAVAVVGLGQWVVDTAFTFGNDGGGTSGGGR